MTLYEGQWGNVEYLAELRKLPDCERELKLVTVKNKVAKLRKQLKIDGFLTDPATGERLKRATPTPTAPGPGHSSAAASGYNQSGPDPGSISVVNKRALKEQKKRQQETGCDYVIYSPDSGHQSLCSGWVWCPLCPQRLEYSPPIVA